MHAMAPSCFCLIQLQWEGLGMCYSTLQDHQRTWMELLPAVHVQWSMNNGTHQFVQAWHFPQLLKSSLGFPTFSMRSVSVACCEEAVQLAHGHLSGRIALNIGALSRCSWEGVTSCLPMPPSWTCLPQKCFRYSIEILNFINKTVLIVRSFKSIFKLLACTAYLPHF